MIFKCRSQGSSRRLWLNSDTFLWIVFSIQSAHGWEQIKSQQLRFLFDFRNIHSVELGVFLLRTDPDRNGLELLGFESRDVFASASCDGIL
jgi:hypothetical protein